MIYIDIIARCETLRRRVMGLAGRAVMLQWPHAIQALPIVQQQSRQRHSRLSTLQARLLYAA